MKPIVKEVSPHVRIIKKPTDINARGDNIEIHTKVGDSWQKYWGTNEMSNDAASTETRELANHLAEKFRQKEMLEKTKGMPVQDFAKEKAEHGFLSASDRDKLIKSGEYKGYSYLKKGGKVSTRNLSNKKSSW